MVTRERLIEQSVQEWVKDVLFNQQGYPEATIEMLDAFPFNRFTGELDKNYVAAGFDFDDQGTQAEVGSDLTTRVYTIEWYTFGISKEWGRNIGHAIKFALETEKAIPLLNITEENWPEIDSMPMVGVTCKHLDVADPEPSQEHVYHTVVRVQDTYSPSLQGWY